MVQHLYFLMLSISLKGRTAYSKKEQFDKKIENKVGKEKVDIRTFSICRENIIRCVWSLLNNLIHSVEN